MSPSSLRAREGDIEGDQAVTVACACEHCGHEFSAEPEGGHRLLCGDSTVATDVERVLGGVKPHLMVTDPPYGVNLPDYRWWGWRRGHRSARTLLDRREA
jgi:hypothetical protein